MVAIVHNYAAVVSTDLKGSIISFEGSFETCAHFPQMAATYHKGSHVVR